MESPEKPIQDQDLDKEWKEQKDREYTESVKATEELCQMSLDDDQDEEKIKKLCKTIGPYGPLQDHLVESEMGEWKNGQYEGTKYKISPYFFEILPIVNRMAKIFENFNVKAHEKGSGHFFSNRDISQIFNDAKYVPDQTDHPFFEDKKEFEVFVSKIKVSGYDGTITLETHFILENGEKIYLNHGEKLEERRNFFKQLETLGIKHS